MNYKKLLNSATVLYSQMVTKKPENHTIDRFLV